MKATNVANPAMPKAVAKPKELAAQPPRTAPMSRPARTTPPNVELTLPRCCPKTSVDMTENLLNSHEAVPTPLTRQSEMSIKVVTVRPTTPMDMANATVATTATRVSPHLAIAVPAGICAINAPTPAAESTVVTS